MCRVYGIVMLAYAWSLCYFICLFHFLFLTDLSVRVCFLVLSYFIFTHDAGLFHFYFHLGKLRFFFLLLLFSFRKGSGNGKLEP